MKLTKIRRGQLLDATTSDENPDTADAVRRVDGEPAAPRRAAPSRRSRIVAFCVLPALAVGLAAAAGYLKWEQTSAQIATSGDHTAEQVAADGTVALLSYRPDTVVQDLDAAQRFLTGQFLDSYRSLTQDVVIPGSQEKQITAVATVPAIAAVSSTADRVVLLAFVNQTVTVGKDAPTNTSSSVRVTVDRAEGQWLISAFDPV